MSLRRKKCWPTTPFLFSSSLSFSRFFFGQMMRSRTPSDAAPATTYTIFRLVSLLMVSSAR